MAESTVTKKLGPNPTREEILANWPAFSAKFALVKPKSSDVKALLGHRSRSAAELRVQAQ